MGNEIITLHCKAKSIVVHAGKTKGARLMWQAPGLDVWVVGRIENYDQARYQAVSECVARHIPAISLRLVRKQTTKNQSVSPKQKELF